MNSDRLTESGPTPEGRALTMAVKAAERATANATTFAHPAYQRAETIFAALKDAHGPELLALAVTLSGGLPLVEGRSLAIQQRLGYRLSDEKQALFEAAGIN